MVVGPMSDDWQQQQWLEQLELERQRQEQLQDSASTATTTETAAAAEAEAERTFRRKYDGDPTYTHRAFRENQRRLIREQSRRTEPTRKPVAALLLALVLFVVGLAWLFLPFNLDLGDPDETATARPQSVPIRPYSLPNSAP